MPEFLPYAAPVVILTALITYFFKVWLPNFLDKAQDIDLEEAKKEVEAHKQELIKQQKEVEAAAGEVARNVAALHEAAAKDEAVSDEEIKKVNANPSSVKEFLKGEGFDVEEIYPE